MTQTLAVILLLAATYAIHVQRSFAHAQPRHISPARERVVHALDRHLAGTPMQGTGRALEASGHKWNVHPAFIAAVAKVESSYGAQVCQPYNAWGLGSCPQLWHPPAFQSWAAAYDYFARWFRGRWAQARSPYDVHGYCVDRSGRDCPRWPGAVAAVMRWFGFGSEVSYP